MRKLIDKDGKIMTYRENNLGAVLIKGKRELYLIFKSVNAGKKARDSIAKFSFNKLFIKGKKIKSLGNNRSHLRFD